MATGSFPPAQHKTPSLGVPPASPLPSSSSASGLRRGLPQEPNERSRTLAKLAVADMEAGRLGSAESNLRLALTWDPKNQECTKLLDEVLKQREVIRKQKPF